MSHWKDDHGGDMPFSYHNKGTCYEHDITVDVSLEHVAWRWVFAAFLHCTVILLPPSVHTLRKQATVCSPHSRDEGREVKLRLLEEGREYLHKLFGILHGRFVSSPPFICSRIYLFTSLFILYFVLQAHFNILAKAYLD